MLKYILKRFAYMAFVFIILSFLIFSLFNLIPGDPARDQLEPFRRDMTPEQYQIEYQALRQSMGLDDPHLVRYGRWFFGLFNGDLGYSQVYRAPVLQIVTEPLKNTVLINIISVILALAITLPLGIVCAVKQKSKLDNVVQVGTILGYSIPIFIISLVFIYIFAGTLGVFPVSGMNTPGVLWVASGGLLGLLTGCIIFPFL